ncbi:NAD(P)/FAD-dependent oxidoreductase [Dendrosporobacter sp. 1207_IL3150]|uniref:NAD(P)/FAD-dependent oxidoreductase n=1 Tax=Dendrosporobacter sp. 1207_IL3150 TaxID=3084054 RepID=UPI002FD8DD36
MMQKVTKADIVIIGGGIVGTAIARDLSKYKLDVVLVEKQPDVAAGTTKANSAILHAGFDAHPDTLKAKLNVRGNALYHELEKELNLDIKWTGSLVVAKTDEEMETINELLVRGNENGVPGLEILSKDEVLAKEPNLSTDVKGALWAPSAGIFLPFGAAVAFADNAIMNGVKVITECTVEEILIENGQVTGVQTDKGTINCKYVINAAGVHADDISRTVGDNSFSIKPRKGEYILFDRKVGGLVNTVVFPAPSKVSKGILICPTVHGNFFIGPNAQDIENKEDISTSPTGMSEIIDRAQGLLPHIPLREAITQFSGIRAAADCGDFVIRKSDYAAGLIHAAGIQSPGLTAAPAIAEFVTEILEKDGLQLIKKDDFKPESTKQIIFKELSLDEKQSLIEENPLYGRVICRCETITEGEIVAAIHQPCGAKTVDGIKRRTRAGMGRCQGGFCGPRVTAILARELNISVAEVRKETAGSYLFFEKIPGDCEVKS